MTGGGVKGGEAPRLLRDILGEFLRCPPEGWAAVPLPDAGLDSMTAVEVVLAIEGTFGVPFPEEALVRETFASYTALEAVVVSMAEPS
ncbi:phosphopantetheine-binding protein [Streptomyces zingiberis]|uniref:Acyl carrier protein n=1 Tax=Streptomyces zingiberis TaxID=2053010 RepID=A0ABX1BRR1_9ACTN|nr:phosphopantetheine-binding protein [Streptomyces zingiberis]NJQ00420.1 acyl carrier protein [Streptomyces zingiberis]